MLKTLFNTLKNNDQNELINNNKTIRLFECKNCGTSYWSAKDICELFEIEEAELVLNGLDPDMKNEIFSDSNKEDWDLSETDKIDVLTLKGVLALLFQSETPFAKYTQRWFIDEVVEKARLAGSKSKELELHPAEAAC